MDPKPGQITYLLQELYSKQKHSQALFQDDHYRHLLTLNLPWNKIFEDIDALADPKARGYLRTLEKQYVQDYIRLVVNGLSLHNKVELANFEKALYAMGLLRDPFFDELEFTAQLNQLEKDTRDYLAEKELSTEYLYDILNHYNRIGEAKLATIKVLKAINEVLFEKYKLQSGSKQLLNIKSHFLQSILGGHRKGILLSLSSIYLIIATRLGLPVYGVNLPRHFILKFEYNEIEVFIDTADSGRLIYRSGITHLLRNLKLPYNENFLDICNFDTIIRRKIANLILLFKRKGSADTVKFLESLSRNLSV